MDTRNYQNIIAPAEPEMERELRRSTMKLSLVEGSFAVVMVGLIETFYVPYLNAMGATTLQIGMAVSLPAFMSAVMQIYTPFALRRTGSRKALAVLTVLVQAACFVPFGLLCLLHRNWTVWAAIAAFLVSAVAGNLGIATWADWMADIVPKRRHGKYFANRNRILGLIQMAIAVSAGFFLDHFAARVMLMFTIIWFVCFAARTTSGLLLNFMYEPPIGLHNQKIGESFWDFLKQLPVVKFGRFTAAVSLLSFGVNFAAPFFAVHMLNNLKLSYTGYTILNITATAAIVSSLGLWGRIIDRIGTIIPLRLCAITIAMIPLPWVLWENYWILFIAQIISGFAWSGFNLGIFIFYLNSVGRKERISYISYFSAVNFSCVFAGATLGGLLGSHLPVISAYQLQTIFVISAILRIPAALIFHWIEEKPYTGRMTALERAFFDPRLNLRTGVARSILQLFRRNI